MIGFCRRASVGLALSALLGGLAGGARADFSFSNFNSTTGLTLIGSAARAGAAPQVLRLTPSGTGGIVGGAWYTAKQQVAGGFRANFTFRISSTTAGGADGFVFLIQNAGTAAIGLDGCRMGYHGIPSSIAVEFDTYQNGACDAGNANDPDGNHISIHTKGTAPNSAEEAASIGITSAIGNMSDGATHTVQVLYTGGVFSVYYDNLATPVISTAINLSSALGLDATGAWVGFTASNGGATENHDISSWSFVSLSPPAQGLHPATPTITEPAYDGRVLNPSDVHMETGPFSDPRGYNHLCTDWEIWGVAPVERVWFTSCITGIERYHTHLGDGVFQGSLTGQHVLAAGKMYRLQVRHRNDSGDPNTEWSYYAERFFMTGVAGASFPLTLDDVPNLPLPDWKATTGTPVVLPGGATPATMTLRSAAGDLLLMLVGAGASNAINNPPALTAHVPVQVRIDAGGAALSLPASTLRLLHDCQYVTIYLPAINLAAGQTALYWVAADGSTFVATAAQTQPDFFTLAQGSLVPWSAFQPGYVVEQFAGNLQLPVNIAFVPNPGPNPTDPFMYVTELYGTIKMITRAGATSDYATGLLNFNPTGAFPGSGEQGLGGIVVDPISGDLFVGMVYEFNANPNAHYPKIVRFHSTDGGRTAATQTTILDMVGATQGQSHFISNFSIGPDGKLYVHNGDGFDSTAGQNLDSYKGKVLRMNFDGSPATDNPLYNAADGINSRDYMYCYGLRNPFGGAWRASDGKHYTVENGPSVDRMWQMVRGRNYLYDGSDASMANYAIYNWNPAHAPVNIAFIQPSTFGGSGFPADKYDHAFVAESGPTYGTGTQALGKRVVEFVLDSAGNRVSGPTTLVEYVGTGQATCVGLAAGPDGLYFTDLYKDQGAASPIDRGANVFRIRAIPNADCNANGQPDWCDIAMGLSLDNNHNGVPDSCEFVCLADIVSVGGNPPRDGLLTGDDFNAFINAFAAGDLLADVTGIGGPPSAPDGLITGDDFNAFISAFASGCP